MPFCLSREELEKLIAVEIDNTIDLEDDKSLELWIEHARNWDEQLVGFTYFLAKIFEKKLKKGQTLENLCEELDKTYNLQESMWFELQEFGPDFIKCLLEAERNAILSLEDQLIQFQSKLCGYEYGKELRY